MAIYHFAVKSISRGQGHSATAAAAYRAGIAIADARTDVTHDYTKRAGVLAVMMLAPKDAPDWASDPAQLWNQAEAVETRKNARVGREIVLSLPHELNESQRADLAREVGALLVERYQVAVQVAIHAPDKGGDDRNHHAHILFSSRQIGPEGFGAYAAKAYDDFKAGPVEIKAVREQVANLTNDHLARAGLDARVDHRRLADQRAAAEARGDFDQAIELDRLPTRKVGKEAERAGRITLENYLIQSENAQHRTALLDRWNQIKAEAAKEVRLMVAASDGPKAAQAAQSEAHASPAVSSIQPLLTPVAAATRPVKGVNLARGGGGGSRPITAGGSTGSTNMSREQLDKKGSDELDVLQAKLLAQQKADRETLATILSQQHSGGRINVRDLPDALRPSWAQDGINNRELDERVKAEQRLKKLQRDEQERKQAADSASRKLSRASQAMAAWQEANPQPTGMAAILDKIKGASGGQTHSERRRNMERAIKEARKKAIHAHDQGYGNAALDARYEQDEERRKIEEIDKKRRKSAPSDLEREIAKLEQRERERLDRKVTIEALRVFEQQQQPTALDAAAQPSASGSKLPKPGPKMR